MAIILGVDPGSRITGYGLIRSEGRLLEYLDSGCIRVGEKPMAERLQTIFHSLAVLIGEYRPEEFAGFHVPTTLIIDQSQGIPYKDMVAIEATHKANPKGRGPFCVRGRSW